MGSNGASGGGAGGNMARYGTPTKPKNKVVEFIKGGGIAGAVIRGVSNVIKTSKTKSKQNMLDYEGQAAGITPMGNPNNSTPDRDGRNVNTQFNVTSNAPTTAEISQSSAVDASPLAEIDTTLTSSRKIKKKGRSMTILTSSKGVKSDDELTLGKKSLLGS